jgi:hypothetical protein
MYNFVLENSNNPELAQTYAALVPANLRTAFGVNEEISDFLEDHIKSIKDLERRFKNIDELFDYINLNKVELEANELVEQEQQEKKTESVEKEINERTPLTVERLRPYTAISTTINELAFEDDSRLGADPQMAYYTQFVKLILANHLNNRTDASTFSGIEYPGVEGGLFISMMRYNKIPAGQVHSKLDLTNPVSKAKYDRDFVYVITDKNGDMLYFDQDYNVGESGKIIYYNTRFLPKKENNRFILTNVSNVQNPTELSKNLGISVELATEMLDSQFKQLEQDYEYLTANPDAVIINSIESGSFGAVVNEDAEYVSLSNVKLDGNPITVQALTKAQAKEVFNSDKAMAGLYTSILNKGVPMYTKSKAISQQDIDLIVSLIMDPVYNRSGNPISLETKKAFIENYIKFSSRDLSINVDTAKQRFRVKYNGKYIDVNNRDAVRTAVSTSSKGFPRDYSMQFEKVNSGNPITLYGIEVDSRTGNKIITFSEYTPQDYMGYVSEVKASIDDNGNIKQYNPYFRLLRSPKELQKTIIPQPAQPITDVSTTTVKELKDNIASRLKNGETITGTISRPANSVTAFEFNEKGQPTVKFYNRNAQPVNEEDINKKATLKLVEKIVTEDGREFTDVIQVYIGDKYLGNIQETDFKASPKVEQVIQKAEPIVQETKNTSTADNRIIEKILKNDELIKRLRNKLDTQGKVRATKEQIELAKKWYESSPLAKHIPFTVMFNAINTKTKGSIATWDIHGITLFKGSDYSDLYHEAWHGFSQTFLTKQDRDNLYKEARKQSGTFRSYLGRTISYQNATPLELEEKLAEDFREYMLSKGKKVIETPVKKNIFQRIFDFLMSLFSKSSVQDIVDNGMGNPVISELYEKLRIGDIVEYTFDQTNADFDVLNSTIETPVTNERDAGIKISKKDAGLLSDTVDTLFAELMDKLNKQGGTNVYTSTLIRDKEGRTLAYQYVEDRLVEILENMLNKRNKMTEEQDTQEIDYNINLLSYALRNYGDSNNPYNTFGLIKYHGENSDFLDFEDRLEDVSDDVNLNEKNEFDRKSGNEVSMKALASTSLLYTIRSLYEYDKNGNVEKTVFGLPKLAKLDKSWNRIINTTEGAIDAQGAYDMLNSVSKDYPAIKQFIDRIGSPANMEAPSLRIWSELEKIVTMPRIPLLSLRVKVEKRKNENGSISRSVLITPTKATGEFRKVGKQWDSFFAIAPAGKYINKNANNINVLNINAVMRDFPSFDEKNVDMVYAFMKAVGMPIEDTPSARESFMDLRTGLPKVVKNIFFTMLSIRSYNNEFAASNPIEITKPSDILKDYKIRTTLQRDDPNADRLKKLKTALAGSSKDMDRLMNWQLKWSDDFADTTVSNAENEDQHERSLRSTISQNISKINAANTVQGLTQEGVSNADDLSMNHLSRRRNPFMKTSRTMARLFDENGDKMTDGKTKAKISLLNMSGVSREITEINDMIDNAGIASASADRTTKRLQDFYMMLLYGVSEATRHADKSTTYLYRVEDPNGNAYFITLDNFYKKFEGTTSTAGRLRFVNYLTGYLASEYERIQDLASDNVAGSVTVGKTNYAKTGSEFVIFDKILDSQLKADLKALRNSGTLPLLSAEQFLDYLKNNPELKQRVEDSISAYLDDEISTFNTELRKDGFYQSQGLINEAIKKFIPSNVNINELAAAKKDDLISAALEAYVTNSWIHKYESTIMFYGDPALYVDVDDFLKRNPGVAATGDIPRSDKYMRDYINAKLTQNSLAKKLGLNPIQFKETMNAAVLQDVVSESVYMKEYVDAAVEKERARLEKIDAPKETINKAVADIKNLFNKAYGEMKEGDGQGWINFDSYKALLISLNKWSPAQDELYNRIVNGENISAAKIMQFFPVKKMQYWGPLKTTGLPVYGFHKYSLVPLIPSLVKGTPMETFQNKMLAQKIDYALFQSGSKINSITDKSGKLDKFYVDNTGKDRTPAFAADDFKFTRNTIFLSYFKDQLEVNDTLKGKVVFPSQLRTLIEEGLMENGVPTDYKPSITNPKKRIEAWTNEKDKNTPNYNRIISYEAKLKKLVSLELDAVKKEIGTDPKSLIAFIRRELTRKEIADHIVDFVDYDGVTNGFKHSLDLSLDAENIERLLVASIEKRILNQKLTGESLVQVSGAGFEKGLFRKATEEENKKFNSTNELQFYRQLSDGTTGAMQVKIAMQGKFKALLETDEVRQLAISENISKLDALNMLLKNEEWMSKNRALVTSIAVRIPTQGLNSMEFMEIAEFLPEENGNLIILPAEIVAKSGGDFDIDKLFTLFPNIKTKTDSVTGDVLERISDELGYKIGKGALARINKTRKLSEKEGVDYLTEEDKEILRLVDEYSYASTKAVLVTGDTKEGIQNDIIDIFRDILSMPDNFTTLITPNTTLTLETIAREMAEKIRGEKKGSKPSSTEIFEVERNLYKQQSNSIGKAILGIIAVNNTFNTIYNRAGVILEPKRVISVTEAGPVTHRQALELPHNNIDGRISLSSLYAEDGINKIADLISQMINGSVDVAKDAWIFDLMADKEVISKLVFMLQAGVPARHAVLFLSQPIIREYVRLQKLYRSMFNEPLNIQDPGTFFRIKARDSILFDSEFGLRKSDYQKNGRGPVQKWKLFGEGIEPIATWNKELFDVDVLDKNLNATEFTDVDRAVFAHFLEIEEMANHTTQVSINLNFDTTKSSSLFNARVSLDKLDNLSNGLSKETIDDIINNSPKGAYSIQRALIDILSGIFPLRDNEVVNDFISDELLNAVAGKRMIDEYKELMGVTTDEEFVRPFRNDLISYIFQKNYYNFNPNDKTYNGADVTYEVASVPFVFAKGAQLKDGTLYVDRAQIKDLFQSGIYSDGRAWRTGTAPVDKFIFDMYDADTAEALFFKYVYQREILRTLELNNYDNISQTEEFKEYLKEEPTAPEKAYEKVLRDRTLESLNYHGYMMLGKNAYAKQVMALRDKYESLFKDYEFLNRLEYVSSKYGTTEISNLRIAGLAKKKEIDRMHEEVLDLINPSVEKVSDPMENLRISNLFSKITHFALLQSGIDTKSSFSLVKYVPQDAYLELIKKPYDDFLKTLQSQEGQDELFTYTQIFVSQYSQQNPISRKLRNYVRNLQTTTESEFLGQYRTKSGMFTVNVDNVTGIITIDPDTTKVLNDGDMAELYKQLPDNALVVYNEIIKDGAPTAGNNSAYRALRDKAVGIPTKLESVPTNAKGKEEKRVFLSAAITDEMTDLEFNTITEYIKEQRDQKGKRLIFVKGYGQYMAGYNEYAEGQTEPAFAPTAPNTFNKLSEALYKNLGYLNPNFLKLEEGKKIIANYMPVTMEDVIEQMKSCRIKK